MCQSKLLQISQKYEKAQKNTNEKNLEKYNQPPSHNPRMITYDLTKNTKQKSATAFHW